MPDLRSLRAEPQGRSQPLRDGVPSASRTDQKLKSCLRHESAPHTHLRPGVCPMMAKMFYTMEEAKAALAKSEEDIKQYAREGRLREFRDGPRLMFKADQVEQLKGELVGGSSGSGLDQVDL